MTHAESTTANRLEKRQTYRRLMFGSVIVGVVASVLLRMLEYPLVGEAVYWVGIVGFLGVWWLTPGSLFDERDVYLERRASQLTLVLAAVVLVVSASTARLLSAAADVTVPPFVWGAIYGYVGLFVIFGASYVWVRYRA